jgi:hypothetical protein
MRKAESPKPLEVAAVIKSLDEDAIRKRIEEIDNERKTLMYLLRVAIRARPPKSE